MTTLKGLFDDRSGKCKRNFIQENIRRLQERRSWQTKEETKRATVKPKVNKLDNVPISTRVSSSVTGAQSSSEQYANVEISNKASLRHVTAVAIKQKSHKNPTTKGSEISRHNLRAEKNNTLGKGDAAAAELDGNTGKNPPTELKLNIMELSASDHEKSPLGISSASRSVGCQTIHPKHLDKLYKGGIIRYPSSRNPAPVKEKEKRPTSEMLVQTVGDTQTVTNSCSPGDQKIAIAPTQLRDPQPSEEGSPQSRDADNVKMKARPVISHLKSPVQKVNDPLRAPSNYQKGVIPKYLVDRQEEWQKEEEQRIREVPDPNCPPGHFSLPDFERAETLKMLKTSHAELVKELNMLPVRSDTLRIRQRKMEIEKQLTKLEAGINVFSRPKVFVKIGV